MKMIKQKKNESIENFKERLRLYEITDSYEHVCKAEKKVTNTMSFDEYKELLDEYNFNYIQITAKKLDGNIVRMCIPTCQYNIMSKANIARIAESFRGI